MGDLLTVQSAGQTANRFPEENRRNQETNSRFGAASDEGDGMGGSLDASHIPTPRTPESTEKPAKSLFSPGDDGEKKMAERFLGGQVKSQPEMWLKSLDKIEKDEVKVGRGKQLTAE